MISQSASKIKADNKRLAEMYAEGLIEPWDLPPLRRRRRHRKRKPSIDRLIRQAERSGKKVTSITTADGATTLTFSEPTPDTGNEWDEALSRGKH
jgi:hypothetical protein